MKNILLTDDELVAMFISLSATKDTEAIPISFLKSIKSVEAKLAVHLQSNPAAVDAIIRLLKSLDDDPKVLKVIGGLQNIADGLRVVNSVISTDEECPLCEGKGLFEHGSGLPCPRCNGTGKLNKKQTYN